MKKNKLFIIIFALLAILLFGTAALCNMCGIVVSTDTTTTSGSESSSNSTSASSASSQTTVADVVTETTVPVETTTETSAEIAGNADLTDIATLAPFFAFANDTGDKLISFYSEDGAAGFEQLNGAIGDNGKFYPIEYIKKQSSNAQDSSRAVTSNFNNMEGYIYGSPGNALTANKTYYLCNSNAINQNSLLESLGNGIIVLDAATKTQIEGIRGRGVSNAWTINEYSDGSKILVVLFAPDGNNFLMSIAIKTAEGIKFMDFPVVSDGQSAWRVDDGGKIDPKLFSILFATKTVDGLLFVVCWAGAEGESIFFLSEKADALNQLPWEIYRYWSPV